MFAGGVYDVSGIVCLPERLMVFLQGNESLGYWLRVVMSFQAHLQECGWSPHSLTLDHDHVDIDGADRWLWKAFSFF